MLTAMVLFIPFATFLAHAGLEVRTIGLKELSSRHGHFHCVLCGFYCRICLSHTLSGY